MKIIKKTLYRQYKQEVELKVTNVIHDLPTWMFPEFFGGSLNTPCPVCNKEMGLNIAHGQHIEKCSMIQVDGFAVYPIHRDCYEKLEEIDNTLD